MRHVISRFLALSVLLLASPAFAQTGGLELTASVDKTEAKVGGGITVTVRLKNIGAEARELPELAEDRQLISFKVKLDDGPESTFEKIHPSPYDMKSDWPTAKLEAGATWQRQYEFPALAVGTFTVTAHYGAWRAIFDAKLAAAKAEVEASPDNKGLAAKLSAVERMKGLDVAAPHVVAAPVSVKIVKADSGETEATVSLVTNVGAMRMRLFPKLALSTCLHFARLIRDGGEVRGERRVPYYRGLTFHRVIRGFMIQGGCPNGDGLGGPGYSIPAELAKRGEDNEVPDIARHLPGRLSMARSGHYDSAGSQFFICVGDSKSLDGEYTVFGEVIRGMDVAYTIAEVETAPEKDKPLEDVTIDTIELLPSAN